MLRSWVDRLAQRLDRLKVISYDIGGFVNIQLSNTASCSGCVLGVELERFLPGFRFGSLVAITSPAKSPTGIAEPSCAFGRTNLLKMKFSGSL